MYIIFLFVLIFVTILTMKDIYCWIVEDEKDRLLYIIMDATILTWAIVRLRLDLLTDLL